MFCMRRTRTQPQKVCGTAKLSTGWIFPRWEWWWGARWGRRGREAGSPGAAGFFFTNGTHVLAGFQPAPKKQFISGLGGKREPSDESIFITAWRETVEELLDIPAREVPPPPSFLAKHPSNTIQTGNYIEFIYSFNDLEMILDYLHNKGVKSPCYLITPLTLYDLLFKRTPSSTAEIKQFCLLPLEKNVKIDPYFEKSIESIQPRVASIPRG